MSEAVDLTLLSGRLVGLEREMRLMRISVDTLVPRVAVMEQSFRDLIGEVSRGFEQHDQRLSRIESRLDTLDAGLTALGSAMADQTALMTQIAALLKGPAPG